MKKKGIKTRKTGEKVVASFNGVKDINELPKTVIADDCKITVTVGRY